MSEFSTMIAISYAREDRSLCVQLKETLESLNTDTAVKDHVHVKTLVDLDQPAINDRFEAFARDFNQADMLIAILTKHSAESRHCRDEWVMAREAGKPLIQLRSHDARLVEAKHPLASDSEPWMLAGGTALPLRWDNTAEHGFENFKTLLNDKLCPAIKAHLLNPREQSRMQATRLINALRDRMADYRNLQHAVNRTWKMQVLTQVLSAAEEEIKSISEKGYEANLSLEHNFLKRAKAVFSSADDVAAVSVDHVSGFWLEKKETAQEYTAHHPKTTFRLFAFGSPENAHAHRFVMHRHWKRYPHVFLCSFDTYKRLARWIFQEAAKKGQLYAEEEYQSWLERDFAILQFEQEGNPQFVRAVLEAGEKLTCIELGENLNERQRLFLDLVEQLRRNEMPSGFDGSIIRWRKAFGEDKDEWRQALKSAFLETEEQDGDVWHVVFFSRQACETEEFREMVRQRVYSLRRRVRRNVGPPLIKQVVFGDHTQHLQGLQVEDAKYGGRLLTNSEVVERFPFCVMLRLENVQDLKDYYESPDHAKVREEIFKLLPPFPGGMEKPIDTLYRVAGATNDRDEKRAIYKGIEGLASRHLQRADFMERVHLDMIIDEPAESW